MAETIKGINVVIGAETTGLAKALSDVDKQAKSIQSELKQVERLLKMDPSNTELLAQKQRLLSDAIATTRERLERLRAVQEQVNEQFQRGEISEGQYRAFQREVVKTEQELQKLEKRLRDMEPAVKSLGERMQEAGDRLTKVGDKLQQTGRNIAEPFAAAGAAIGAGLGLAVKTAADFEAQMDRVGAIAGATAEEMEALTATALELGASTSKSASEVAQGMELMAAMGFSALQVIDAMPGVIAAAEASGEDMALVAETMASALNAFGLEASEASRVADVLAQTANVSAAGIRDMQYAFKYAAPVAKTLGISLEELSAAIAIMANNGIRGEQAGTTLRAALLRLVDPPKEAAAMLKQLGVEVVDAQGRFRPFNEIIADLAKATANMTNAQKDAALATIFGTEAMSGMLTVIEAGPDKLNELTKALENSAGASAEAAAKMKDNLQGALEELGGSIETAQIAIGSALSPAIRQIAEFIQTLVDAFNSLPEGAKQFIAFGTAITGAIMLLVAAFGGLLIIIGSVMSAIGTITAAFGGASAAITGLLGPIGLVAAAVAGLVAVGALVVANWEAIRDTAAQVWDQILRVVQPAVDDVVGFIRTTFEDLAEWWRQIWPDLQQAFTNIWNGIMAFLRPVINAMVALFQWAWPLIQAVVVETWENIKNVISSALNIITGIINAFAALFTGNWSMLWENIKQIISNALNLIWNLFQLWGTGKILKFVGYLGGQLSKIFRAIWDEAYGIFKSALDKLFGVVKNVFDNILSFITGLGRKFYDAGKGLIEQIKKGIESAVDTVVESVRRLAQKIRDFLPFSPAKTGPLSDLDKLDFGGPIASSIQRAIPRVQGLLSEMLALPNSGLNVNVFGGVQSGGGTVINMEGLFAGATIIIREEADLERWSEITARRVAMLSRY
mgnify:CR=1 FL=1